MKTLNLFNNDEDQQRAKSAEELLSEAARALAEHCGKDYASISVEVTLSRANPPCFAWKAFVAERTMTHDCPSLPALFERVAPWGDEESWKKLQALKTEREELAKKLNADNA